MTINKFRIKCRVKWRCFFYNFERGVKWIWSNVIKGISKIQLPTIALFTMLILILIILCIFVPHLAAIGESKILAFYYKLELFGVLLTAVSLIAAAMTILIALQKPK